MTLLLSVAAAVAGWLLARQLVVPLSRLGVRVERIAAGVRPVTLTSGAPREIEELAVAVQSMANKLDEQAAQEERTRLARELAKIDPKEEMQLAEQGLGDQAWPEY